MRLKRNPNGCNWFYLHTLDDAPPAKKMCAATADAMAENDMPDEVDIFEFAEKVIPLSWYSMTSLNNCAPLSPEVHDVIGPLDDGDQKSSDEEVMAVLSHVGIGDVIDGFGYVVDDGTGAEDAIEHLEKEALFKHPGGLFALPLEANTDDPTINFTNNEANMIMQGSASTTSETRSDVDI